MGWILLGAGLVLVIEGLVFALAPSRLDDVVELIRQIPPETRRMLGLGAVATAWRGAGRGRLVQASTAGVFMTVALLVSPGSWVVHFSLTTLALVDRHLRSGRPTAPGSCAWTGG